MRARKHTVDEVLRSLSRKHDVRVYPNTKEILVLNGKSKKPQFHAVHDLGNKSWGKIDYLVNYNDYTQKFVSEW